MEVSSSDSIFVCSLCGARSRSLSLWMSHLCQVHSNEDDLSLKCPFHDCPAVYSYVNSLCSHIYRKHQERGTGQASGASSSFIPLISSNESAPLQSSVDNVGAMEESIMEELSLHKIVDSSLERKRKSCLFLMQLKEERMLTQVAIDDVVGGCKDLVSHALHSVRSQVSRVPPQNATEIYDILEEVSNPFEGLETAYLQDKFILKEMECIVRITA